MGEPAAGEASRAMIRSWQKRLRSLNDPKLPSWKRPSVLYVPRHLLFYRRDWSNLGEGPAGLVAEQLLGIDVADYIRFRAVCCSWRQWSTDPRSHGVLDRRFHPRKWIMLRKTHDHRCRLLNVCTRQSIRVPRLPELLRGHDVFGYATEGLLVLLDRSSYVVRLLNPLTCQITDLPPATSLLRFMKYELPPTADLRKKFEVSDAGLANDSTFAVYFSEMHMLAVAKPGDECWTLVDVQGSLIRPASSISFEGRFYCPTNRGVMVVETSANQPPQLVLAAKLTKRFSLMLSSVHLVDNGGELVLVYRYDDEVVEFSDNGKKSFTRYNAYLVDLKAVNSRPIFELGGRAIFIGFRSALSVSTSVFPSIKWDSIYLRLDAMLCTNFKSNTLYCLTDGTTQRCGIFERENFDEKLSSGIPQFGPWGIDDYLSLYVTEYEDDIEDA